MASRNDMVILILDLRELGLIVINIVEIRETSIGERIYVHLIRP